MKGFFIALEGIDGCGKSTQLKALAEWLPTSGLMPDGAQLVVTREPGGTSLGIKLREILLNSYNDEPCYKSELLLFMADRAQNVAHVIKPALLKGDWVLCDRFTASTIAYQGYGKFLSLKNIEVLNDYSSTGLKPNLTLWLDISIDEAIKRIKNKQPDRFEKNGYSFLERVRHGFSVTADLNKTQQQKFRRGSMIRIDGSQSVELVTQRCKEVITLWSR